MQIKKLLKIENIIEGRAIPCDMLDDSLNSHYSKSRGEEIKIIDMHLPHLVRAYSNLLEENKLDIQLYKEGWNDALESLKK
tara:strand:- start:575 stop:817 length:243 start_codon:yes stop_codon:yes gene_type:complete